MYTLTLSDDDARFLLDQLSRHAIRLEGELIHTDARAMQRELAAELSRLNQLRDAIAASASAPPPASVPIHVQAAPR